MSKKEKMKKIKHNKCKKIRTQTKGDTNENL